ncbi:MAG: sulfotransferase family protein [Solirubrobacterales bacterium]
MTAPTKPSSPAGASTGSSAGGAAAAAAPDRAIAGSVPDFFIVGHQKCGTTALYLMLSEHPQIFMPREVKEPWFFGRELRPRSPQAGTHSRPSTLEQYVSLFADAAPGQLVGEASPQTIRSQPAAGEIAALRPDARIVAILREPASFLRSLHMQLLATHIESEKDFARAIALEPKRREGKRIPRRSVSPPSLLYSDHIRYTEQLRRLHEAFGPEQVLVLIYDDFRKDNLATVREVLSFLGADPSVPLEQVETKPLKGVRSSTLHRLRRQIRRVGLNPAAEGKLARALDAVAPKPLRSDSLSAAFRRITYGPQRPADEQLMLELRRRFKGEVQAAGDYLGRDLVTLWGYDRIS